MIDYSILTTIVYGRRALRDQTSIQPAASPHSANLYSAQSLFCAPDAHRDSSPTYDGRALIVYTMPLLPNALHAALKPLVEKATATLGTDTENAVIVQCSEGILVLLKQHHYATMRQWPCKQMGVHMSNRNGEGIVWIRAHSRVSKIAKIGFHWPTADANAVAIEVCPHDKKHALFTVALREKSDRYAMYKVDEIGAVSLGAGHANHGMACAIDGVPCSFPNISVNGRMCAQKISADPNFKDAIEKGMNFLTIKWEVEADFPQIPTIVQAALNAISQVAEGARIVVYAFWKTQYKTTDGKAIRMW